MSDSVGAWLKLKILMAYIWRAAKRYLKVNETIYVKDRIPEYREFWKSAAEALSLEFVPLTDELWEIKSSERRIRVANYKIPLNDPIVFYLCANRSISYQFAMEQDVPVPDHSVFRLQDLKKAKAFVTEGNDAYVVKPARDTGSGRGITTQVRTGRQMERAAILASTYCDEFLVERMVMAESCKLLFVGGEFIHASRRRGVRVVGDGQGTIRQLMLAQEGCDDDTFDLTTDLTLQAQGFTTGTVLPAGQEVVARSYPKEERNFEELRTVYDETITELICPELVEECAALVKSIGCDLASVDVITNEPGKSLKNSGGVFIEVNANPGIHHHYNNEEDYANSVAIKILQFLFS